MAEKAGKGWIQVRVLWIAYGCSLQSGEANPNLTARHERVMIRHGADRVKLAVAFMADDLHRDFLERDGISYYPVHADMRIGIREEEWQKTSEELMRVIGEFRPDVIHCFGAEWPYGRIAAETDVPVIIHMMGFLNAYCEALDIAHGYAKEASLYLRIKRSVKAIVRRVSNASEEQSAGFERMVMSCNRYYMGRTEWDKSIVKYYSPGAKYFYAPEAVKKSVYDAAGRWDYHFNGRLRLFTHSIGDERKGNEIILRTAKVLKEVVGIDFIWKVAGDTKDILTRAKHLGISCTQLGIELLGMLNDKEIIKEIKDADVYVFSSVIDNSPHSICEAQLIGCPVIATNVGGVPQLIDNGRTGFLYPYNEPHTLAFLIADIYRDGKLLREISRNEVKEAVKRNDPKSIADTLIDIYKEVIEDHDKS